MTEQLSGVLEGHGVRRAAAAALAAMFEWVGTGLRSRGIDHSAGDALFVPGRIEVLGKHTDYAGGRSLLCAADRGICAVAAPRTDNLVHLVDVGWAEERVFPLDPGLEPPAADWGNYPMTVARRVARNFPAARRGVTLGFASSLPPASGMSSSSALLTATFLALARANALEGSRSWRDNIHSPEDLAEYLGAVENGQSFRGLPGDRGVGTFGGSEDHTAILCCRPDAFSLYGFCPVQHERQVPMPAGHALLVAASGVAAEKTGAAQTRYNQASRQVAATLDHWRQATGRSDASLGAAVRSSADAPARIREVIRARAASAEEPLRVDRLIDRFDQFHEESERIIPEAADALASGRLDAFGALVDRSEALAERLLGNQIPETIFLARTAREIGAVAASAFGAGFGGSVWALVAAEAVAPTEAEWAARYRRAFPERAPGARFFSTAPGPAAFRFSPAAPVARPAVRGLISPAHWS